MVPMTRYDPARTYLVSAVAALALAGFSGWVGWGWTPAFLPATLLLLSSAGLAILATRPPIVIRENSCTVGEQSFLWSEVERLDTVGWATPLLVRVTLRDGRAIRLIYPGEPKTAARLLRQMRRLSQGAQIEGIPYRQYWGAPGSSAGAKTAGSGPQYQVVRPEEEAEIERLYQRLKSAGRLDHQTSSEERRE